jgi:hypothetical protein
MREGTRKIGEVPFAILKIGRVKVMLPSKLGRHKPRKAV